MSRRKVKKGRFLNETQAEKNLKAKLDPKVNALRDRLDAELTTAIQEKEMDRVSTQQGIAAADREQRVATTIDTGLAKNVALTAQLASNAVADMTTGRRVGTAEEVQTDVDVAKAVSGKEQIEDKGELRKTGQIANIDLTEAAAKEKGDLAKRGALYNTASGFISGRLTAAGKALTKDPGYTVDAKGMAVPAERPSLFEAIMDPTLGGSSLAKVDYAPKDIKTLQSSKGSGLAFS
jgi:hypothetical protein